MKKSKRGFFKFLLETTIMATLSYLQKKLVKPIKHKEVHEFLGKRIDDLKMVTKIITDTDPDDNAQLEVLWKQQIKPSLEGDGLNTARVLIEQKVKDEDVKAVLLGVLDSYIDEYGQAA